MNATLVINDNVGLEKDVWQEGDNSFTAEQWQEAINNFADTMQKIYYAADYQLDIEDGDLYILGDAINLLRSIDIKILDQEGR